MDNVWKPMDPGKTHNNEFGIVCKTHFSGVCDIMHDFALFLHQQYIEIYITI